MFWTSLKHIKQLGLSLGVPGPISGRPLLFFKTFPVVVQPRFSNKNIYRKYYIRNSDAGFLSIFMAFPYVSLIVSGRSKKRPVSGRNLHISYHTAEPYLILAKSTYLYLFPFWYVCWSLVYHNTALLKKKGREVHVSPLKKASLAVKVSWKYRNPVWPSRWPCTSFSLFYTNTHAYAYTSSVDSVCVGGV